MGEWWERKDHPLLNDVILNYLFHFVKGKDLKAYRLVCQKWCESTLPFVRSKFEIKLHGNSEEMKKRLTDFVEVFKQNKLGIPFVKYSMDPFCATEGPGQEFLQLSGSTAKSVSLTGEGRHSVTQLTVEVEDISELLKAMPNIEFFGVSHRIHSRAGNTVKLFPDDSSTKTKPSLNFLKELQVRVSYRGRDRDKTNDCCPTLIEEILFIAPNLSNVVIVDNTNNPDRNRIGQLLQAIKKFKLESGIKKLTLTAAHAQHVQHLQRLAESGLKLTNLNFELGTNRGEDKDSIKYVPELARIFKNSLEDLEVDEVCPSFSQLPHMPMLERLDFKISKDFDSKCVNLNKLLPALKILVLYSRDFDGELEELLPNSEPCPNIKALSLEQVVGDELFNHILSIFPKLTKLQFDVGTDGAQILTKVMTQMPQLEELSLNGTIEGIESIDALLTGIPVERFQELEHVITKLKEMTMQPRLDTIRHYRDRYSQFPSIANLTKLRNLSLTTHGRDGENDDEEDDEENDDDEDDEENESETRMTDIFLFFGLYSMTNIKHLEILNCEFTPTGCEILTRDMDLETWTFEDENGDDILPVEMR